MIGAFAMWPLKPDGTSHSPAGRLGYLDGWRGLAILTVLAGHFVNSLSDAGSFGVEILFVLSRPAHGSDS